MDKFYELAKESMKYQKTWKSIFEACCRQCRAKLLSTVLQNRNPEQQSEVMKTTLTNLCATCSRRKEAILRNVTK